MINQYIKNMFNFINYFTLACIIPIGYFAPLGEWLLLSLLSISTLLNMFFNTTKINFNNVFIFSTSILIIFISYFWSINPERTIEVIGPISGIIIAIFITLNVTSNNKITNLENLIGIPLILTSICILLDMILNAEIRSNLALLAGDEPTSRSANFGRGIIILLMIMPFLALSVYFKNFNYIIFCFASYLFFLIFSKDLIKDLESLKGDIVYSYKTIPAVYDSRITKIIFSFLILIIFIPVYYLIIEDLGLMSYYFILCIPFFLIVLLLLWLYNKDEIYLIIHNLLKAWILIGILSISLLNFNY